MLTFYGLCEGGRINGSCTVQLVFNSIDLELMHERKTNTGASCLINNLCETVGSLDMFKGERHTSDHCVYALCASATAILRAHCGQRIPSTNNRGRNLYCGGVRIGKLSIELVVNMCLWVWVSAECVCERIQ